MKKKGLWLAAALVLTGAVLLGVSWLLGARPVSLLQFDFPDEDNAYVVGGVYEITDKTVNAIELDWTAGDVTVLTGGDCIRLEESAAEEISEEQALRYGVSDGTLHITDRKAGIYTDQPVKRLTLTIPEKLAASLRSFSVSGASASLCLSDLTAEEFSFDTASGDLTAKNVTASTVSLQAASGKLAFSGAYEKLDAESTSGALQLESLGDARKTGANTASGDVSLTGKLGALSASTTSGRVEVRNAAADEVEIDTASGSVSLLCDVLEAEVETTSGDVSLGFGTPPAALDVETASGSVTLTLPADSSFTLQYDTASGTLQNALPAVLTGNRIKCGEGGAEFSVSTTSGDLNITAA